MTTLRHDFMVSAVRRVISRASCASSAEPAYRHLRRSSQREGAEGQRRGDILAVLPGGRISVLDVVVTHPAAPSYVAAAARSDGAAAKRAADRKQQEFCRFGDQAQYTFVPFAVETYGRLGDDALGFVNALATIAAANGRVSKATFVANALRELSCSLQQGNARMYARSLFEVARAGGRQFMPGCEVPVAAMGLV